MAAILPNIFCNQLVYRGELSITQYYFCWEVFECCAHLLRCCSHTQYSTCSKAQYSIMYWAHINIHRENAWIQNLQLLFLNLCFLQGNICQYFPTLPTLYFQVSYNRDPQWMHGECIDPEEGQQTPAHQMDLYRRLRRIWRGRDRNS